MRFGNGGPSEVLDLLPDYEDDAFWEVTRGRRDVRHVHDPLVRRVKELRAQSTAEVRRELDVLKYGSVGRRVARLRARLDRGGHLTTEERARLEAHEARLLALYAKLDRGRTE